MFECPGCGFKTDDELALLTHMIDCPSKPESMWKAYIAALATEGQAFKNSEILEEEK